MVRGMMHTVSYGDFSINPPQLHPKNTDKAVERLTPLSFPNHSMVEGEFWPPGMGSRASVSLGKMHRSRMSFWNGFLLSGLVPLMPIEFGRDSLLRIILESNFLWVSGSQKQLGFRKISQSALPKKNWFATKENVGRSTRQHEITSYS